jgi:U3 small nucleolar RNA-associated protein 22
LTYRNSVDLLEEAAKDDQKAPDLSWTAWLTRRIAQVLARGLSDRVTLLRTRTLVLGQYDLDHTPASLGQQVVVGLILNPETSQRLVDLGPPADDTAKVCVQHHQPTLEWSLTSRGVVQQAAEFRQFWGPKSEMRRFKDGKINESVGAFPATKPTVP